MRGSEEPLMFLCLTASEICDRNSCGGERIPIQLSNQFPAGTLYRTSRPRFGKPNSQHRHYVENDHGETAEEGDHSSNDMRCQS